MKKILLKVLIAMIVILGLTCIAMAEVPYTFSPGTTAKSSEVNANFQHVNYGNIVVKANGVEIGTLISLQEGLNGHFFVLNAKGYFIKLRNYPAGTLLPNRMFYETTNCTGTAYIRSDYRGIVYSREDGPIFYIDKTATAVNVIMQSSFDFQTFHCNTEEYGEGPFFPAIPNNPAVTGVNSNTYALPITIERR